MTRRIFIAGPSASGKSTLAKAVAARVGARRFCLDDYFIPRARVFVDTNGGPVRTFERPELYDAARLARHVAAVPGPVVTEGFCLLGYPEFREQDALRVYVDVPFDICLARRLARRPIRPSDQSFRIIGRSESAAFVEPQRKVPGVVVLDGRNSTDELVCAVLACLQR